MADVQLTKDNFVDQITRYGYFSEIIPECFCSDKLADQITDVISSVKTTKGKKEFQHLYPFQHIKVPLIAESFQFLIQNHF